VLTKARMRSILDHVECRLAHRVSIQHLANLAHMSSSDFSRAFKLVVGMPPVRYVGLRRIERAKALMLSTTYPLAKIAIDCGFADQSHLNRAFRGSMRITPPKWRRGQSECEKPV